MDDTINWILYFCDGEQLFDIAVKFKGNALTEDEKLYPLEPETQKKIIDMLPLHCKGLGRIVQWREIFDVVKTN